MTPLTGRNELDLKSWIFERRGEEEEVEGNMALGYQEKERMGQRRLGKTRKMGHKLN